MNKYENVTVVVSRHAYKQYCERAEPIEEQELKQLCQNQLTQGDYGYNDGEFIHLSGVWWVHRLDDGVVLFITCYGRTTILMPKAIGWAIRHNDRINLSDLIR